MKKACTRAVIENKHIPHRLSSAMSSKPLPINRFADLTRTGRGKANKSEKIENEKSEIPLEARAIALIIALKRFILWHRKIHGANNRQKHSPDSWRSLEDQQISFQN